MLANLEACAEKNRQLLKKFKTLWPDKYKKVVSDIKSIADDKPQSIQTQAVVNRAVTGESIELR